MARTTTQTTRRVNRQVVEALEAAHIAGVRAAEGWIALEKHLEEVVSVTPFHDDLAGDAASLYSQLDEVRHQIQLRLDVEREGRD